MIILNTKLSNLSFWRFVMRTLIALAALIVILPKIGLQCLIALYHQKRITLWSCEYAGRDLRTIKHRTILIANHPLADLDKWLHYLKGNLNLVGPKAIELRDAINMSSEKQARFKIAPGIISPYEIKKRSGIAHVSEQQIAEQFIQNTSISKRLMLVTTYCIQMLTGRKAVTLKAPLTVK